MFFLSIFHSITIFKKDFTIITSFSNIDGKFTNYNIIIMCKKYLFIISFLLCCLCCTAEAKEKWYSSFPPLDMELDQAIVSAFATKLNAEVKGSKVPFARRLLQLKTGQIDLLVGILKNPEREDYAYFLTPPYKEKTNKIFIMRKGEGNQLKQYEDLYNLTVGVQIGSKYFPRFDEDLKIHKISSTEDESRLKMLLKNRFDALIHTEFYGTYLIYELGLQKQVEIAHYKYTKRNPVYMAISKKSPLFKRKDELQAVFGQMVQSGEIDTVIHTYFDSISMPVPELK